MTTPSTPSTPSPAANTAATSVTHTTTFAYNDLGLLTQSTLDDGTTHCLCYYPATADSKPDRSDAAPTLTSLLSGLKLENDTSLASALTLSCPVLPNSGLTPLLGQWEYLAFPDGSKHAVSFSLYGYVKAQQDSKGVLTPDTVLNLEGVDVDTSTTPWTVTKAEGREGLLVTLLQVAQDTAKGSIVRTSTVWYKDNMARKTHTVTESIASLDTGSGLLAKITSPLKVGNLELTAVLAQKIRSPYSARVLRETLQDEKGQANEQTFSTYDVRGRATGSSLYPYNEATFSSGESFAKAVSRQTTTWQDTGAGTWVTVSGPDGRHGRTLLDGLQRPVRQELQIAPGTDHSEQNYCLLQETHYDNEGDIVREVVYDYLPGGLRRSHSGTLPTQLQGWFWQAEKTTLSAEAKGQSRTWETAVGTFGQGLQITRQDKQINHDDGQVSQFTQYWLPKEAADKNSGVKTERKTNTKGQLVEVSETEPAADGTFPTKPTRTWTVSYDELHRRTTLTCPDSAVVNWAYAGLATTPISVKVTKGNKTQVVGSQALGKDNRIASRTPGQNTALTQQFADNGLTQPNKTRLYRQDSADGNSASWYAEATAQAGVKAVAVPLATFTYDAVARAVNSTFPASGTRQSLVTASSTAPQLFGLYRVKRTVRGVDQPLKVQRSLRGAVHGVRHTNGVNSRASQNDRGMRAQVRRGQFDYLYAYDAMGQLKQLTVLGTGSERLVMNLTYDAQGRETERSYLLANKKVKRYAQTWSAAGKLLSKTLYRDGSTTAARTETYTYDPQRGWLLSWEVKTVAGEQAITDSTGKAISKQVYQYDVLSNLTQCVTTWADNSQETRDYSHDASYPTQRSSVKVTPTDAKGVAGAPTTATLAYDDNGNLTTNERGETLTYTVSGQLASVIGKGDVLQSTYEYDEQGRLAAQYDNLNKQRRVLVYSASKYCGEVWLDDAGKVLKRRVADEEAGLVVQVFTAKEMGEDCQTLFTLADPQNGGGDEYRFDSAGTRSHKSATFTPWGEAQLSHLNTLDSGLGFNSQRVDPVTGSYHLGDGYRTYDPQAKMFGTADSWAPFGEGGLNDRAYCSGDPVNWHDPSGHIMINRQAQAQELAGYDQMIEDTKAPAHEPAAWWEWMILGLAIGFTIIAALCTGGLAMVVMLGVLAVTTALTVTGMVLRETNPGLSQALEMTGMAIGVADMATGLLKGGVNYIKKGIEALKALRQAVKVKMGAAWKSLRASGTSFKTRAANTLRARKTHTNAFGNQQDNVQVVRDPGRQTTWYHEQTATPSGQTAHHWGADTEITQNNLRDPFTQISRRASTSSVHVYSGSHGVEHGNTWLSAPHTPGGVQRNSLLDYPKFFKEDSRRFTSQAGGLFHHRNTHVHRLSSKTPVTHLDLLESLPGHHVHAFCFSRNDERLLANLSLQPVTSYLNSNSFGNKFMKTMGDIKKGLLKLVP